MDTNVLVYSTRIVGEKSIIAKSIVVSGAVLSVQVLNEFIRVTTHKFRAPLESALLALVPIKNNCEIMPLTSETHELAISIALRHDVQIFDANIIAAAQLAGCDTLFSEDLSHGQRFGRVQVVNPFIAM